jgi:hypothetical protein
MYREYTFFTLFLILTCIWYMVWCFDFCYFGMGRIVISDGLTVQNDVDVALIYRTK